MKLRSLVVVGLCLLGALLVSRLGFRSQTVAPVSAQVVSLPPAPAPVAVAAPVGPELAAPLPTAALANAQGVAVPASQVIASAWSQTTEPAFVAFRDWTQRYLAAPADARVALLDEGRALATARRAVLAQLIRLDPRAALAAAVPMVVRQQLPEAVTALLEKRVSGTGELALNAVTPAPGEAAAVAEPVFRSALIAGEEFRAYVYGRREKVATLTSATMVGIAVDAALAVSESPLRVLESGEQAAGRVVNSLCEETGIAPPVAPEAPLNVAMPVAVEIAGAVRVCCAHMSVGALEAGLIAGEVAADTSAGDNLPGTSGVTSRPSQAWTHGVKKVLIIRVDFSDFPGVPVYPYSPNAPLTDDYIVTLFNQAQGLRAYYEAGSYGKSSVQIAATVAGDSPDVTPVFRMPQTGSAYALGALNSTLHTDARAAAQAAGINVESYDRIGVVFPNLGTSNVPNSKITYGGLGNIIGKNFWVNGFYDFRVVGHEIGHNYGLSHSNLWQVSDGNPISPNGTTDEYGDIFDLMGEGDFFENDFSHWNKSLLQWIPDSAVTVVQSPGTYRVYRFDAAAANLANARALKLVRDTTRDYWIGYRRGTSNASLDGGAYVLWGYNERTQGNLLDLTTPGTSPNDAGLAIGATFNDTVAGITLRPIAQGGSGAEEYLDVEIGLLPLVQWSAASYQTPEQGGTVTLIAKRTRNSAGALSVNYATASGTATSGTDFTAGSGTLTWAAGETGDKTVTITVVADAVVESSETFTVTLSGVSGGIIGDLGVATVAINDPGVRDPAFAAEFINSTIEKMLPLPDGSVLLGGWFGSVQDAAFESYARSGVTKVNASGALDPTFAADGGATGSPVYDLARQPDGRILVAGNFTAFNGTTRGRIVRLLTDGSVDATFDSSVGANGTVYAVLVQPDGKIVIGGGFTTYNGVAREYLARLNADGSLDTSFVGPDFASSTGWRVQSLAFQPDGKLLVGGSFYFSGGSTFQSGICRVTNTGARDASFSGVAQGAHVAGTPGSLRTVERIVVQPSGQILISGGFTAYNNTAAGGIACLTSTGALDPAFTATTDGAVSALLQLPDGRILLGGTFATVNGSAASRLAQLSSDGALDTAFAAAGGYTEAVQDLALLPDGRVMLAGDFGSLQSATPERPLWRFFSGLAGAPGTVQLASDSLSATEGGNATLSVTRTGTGLGALTVGYSTVAGTAGAADYTTTAGVLTWAAGDLAPKTISVPLTTDSSADDSETLFVNLGSPLVGGTILGSAQQATVTILDPVLTGYAAWQQSNFTSGEIANATISGPTADPDADGLTNLVEYALGLAPKTATTSALPQATASGSDWVYTYTRPAARNGLTYAVEISTTLTSWTTSGVTHEFVSSTGGIDTWRARYPMASAANAFFRLKVTQP